MKKITFLSLIAGLAIIMSCGKDDTFTNQLSMDDLDLGEFGAYYDDYGTYCLTGPSREEQCATHEGVAFLFSDGDYAEEAYWPSNYTFTVYGTFLHPIDSEIAGTYELNNSYYLSNQTGKRVATFSAEFPEEVNGCCVFGVEGTITITGTLPNLTVTINAMLDYYDYDLNARGEEAPNATMEIIGQYKGEFLMRAID